MRAPREIDSEAGVSMMGGITATMASGRLIPGSSYSRGGLAGGYNGPVCDFTHLYGMQQGLDCLSRGSAMVETGNLISRRITVSFLLLGRHMHGGVRPVVGACELTAWC
jgi:hypothetical protein